MASLATIAHSFTAPRIRHPPTRTMTTRTLLAKPMSSPQPQHHDDQGEQPKADLSKIFYQFAAGFALTTTLWTAVPAMDLQSFVFPTSSSDSSRPPLLMAMTANAKEMASGSGSRVNKDPESLLRYGLPISNKEVSACVRAALLFFSRSLSCFLLLLRVVSCRGLLESSNYLNHQVLHATRYTLVIHQLAFINSTNN
jgi:hypothetical protein